MGTKSPSAKAYLLKIDPVTWALYPHAKEVALFSHCTSNLIESTNRKFL